MRLTILNQFYPPDISPTAHLAGSLAEHRAARGDQVTVITSHGGYVKRSHVHQVGRETTNPRVVRLWTPQLGKGRKLSRIIDYAFFYVSSAVCMLKLPRQDVIVSLTTPPFIAVTALLHKMLHRRTKLVLWNMDCYPEAMERFGVIAEHGLLARAMRMINRMLFARLDHLVSLDTSMQELLLSQYAPEGRSLAATTIPNWENISLFPIDADPPSWQQADALGLRDRFVVLYLGNMGYGHRFDTVLAAASMLRDEPVTFLFVGGGSRQHEIEEATNRLNLANVVVCGYVPKEQTPSVMKAAHCALITLDDAALGVMSPSKLHSTLAMGLPVIYVGPQGSNVDAAIQRYQCGFSIRHGEAVRLADCVKRLSKSAPDNESLRRRARQAFDDAYCDTRTLPQFDDVLDELQVLNRGEKLNRLA